MIRSKRHITRVGKRNQVTLPVEMLRALGVAAGEAIEVAQDDDGSLRIRRATEAIDRAFGMLNRPGRTALSAADLKREARFEGERAATDRYQRAIRGGH